MSSSLCGIFGCTRKKRNQNNQNNERNRIHFSTLHNQSNLNNQSYIESGQFGFTYVYGDKVIKVYTQPTNTDKIYNTAKKIANMTGNNNQLVQIINGLKKKHLPMSVINKVPGNSNTNLQAIRMPHLGIDLLMAINERNNMARLRMLPISTLMEQCHKLIKNIDIIRRNKECYCDVRLENIMIRPNTGEMTLIDFDIYGSFTSGFSYSTYHVNTALDEIPQRIPPEFISLKAIKDGLDNTESAPYKRFATIFFNKYVNHPNMERFLECIGKNGNQKSAYFLRSLAGNIKYILLQQSDNKNKQISNNIMNYFDYFGFGMAMTVFFSALRPISALQSNRKTKRKSATISEIVASRELDAFHKMQRLLMKMCDYSIEKRPHPDTVLKTMETIMSSISIESLQALISSRVNNQVSISPNMSLQTSSDTKKYKITAK